MRARRCRKKNAAGGHNPEARGTGVATVNGSASVVPPAVFARSNVRKHSGSFLTPHLSSSSSEPGAGAGGRGRGPAWGKNLDFAKIEFALCQAVSPNEIAIAAGTDTDFCWCIPVVPFALGGGLH